MLQPKTKFRKTFRAASMAMQRAARLNWLLWPQGQEPERITARQIEAARRAITATSAVRAVVDPRVPRRSGHQEAGPKSVRVRVRALIEYWAARVKPGRILFELDGVPGPLAAEAFSRAAMKLPIKTKVVARLATLAPGEPSNDQDR